MKYPNDFLNKIVCGDVLKVIQHIPDRSIDLIVTSPPYNLKNSTGNGMKDGRGGKWANAALQKGYSHHNDCMPHDEYVKWQRKCLNQMMRVLTGDGAIFYNHKWRVQNGLLQDRSDIVNGFPVRQILIWRRKGGINFNPGYFLPTYEVIYVIANQQFKLAPKANAYGDVWEFTQEMNNDHPAAFPVDLITRIISSTSSRVVLDPFMGSGTTAIAASNLNRDYIGIEISPQYCTMAEERLKHNSVHREIVIAKQKALFPLRNENFRWPEKDLLALSPLVRLLWGSIIDEMITTYDKKQGRGCNPVLLIVDEAGRTPIPMLADHASTVVGRKIYLWIAVQSLSQLETVYGRYRANTLRDNMDSQIYHRPSSQETAEYLERCLGRTSEYAHSQTKRDGTRVSLGLSEQGVPLMTAGEIKMMRDEETIAFHRNLAPMRLTRMDWRNSTHDLAPGFRTGR